MKEKLSNSVKENLQDGFNDFDKKLLDGMQEATKSHFELLFNFPDKFTKGLDKKLGSFFGRDVSAVELSNMINLDNWGIDSYALVYKDENGILFSDGWEIDEKAIKVLIVFREDDQYAGLARMSFYREGDKKVMYVHNRRLTKDFQEAGLGIDMQCQIEEFCRKENISDMKNHAHTFNGDVGAYAWAVCGGFEFDNDKDIEKLKGYICEHAEYLGVTIDEDSFAKIKTPFDLVNFVVKDDKGNDVMIAKDVLLGRSSSDGATWDGKVNIPLKGGALEERLKYLKNKGRDDLITKYYSNKD